MQRQHAAVAAVASVLLLLLPAHSSAQQLPLAPSSARGQTVQPVFEGWYRNADGSYSLSFGYYNRNTEEVLHIPVGANNFMQPAQFNGVQPGVFEPRRHWGVFAVRVPADFGDTQRVVWTVVVRGDTLRVPGSLRRGWEIDAIAGEAGSGNTPPKLRFSESGPEGAGPAGVMGEPLRAMVGTPLTLNVWATDDFRGRTAAARTTPVALMWFKHQGQGEVKFAAASLRVDTTTNRATTTATFSEPGEYLLRVRANDASGVSGAGHAQCCWSNGFIKVTVTR